MPCWRWSSKHSRNCGPSAGSGRGVAPTLPRSSASPLVKFVDIVNAQEVQTRELASAACAAATSFRWYSCLPSSTIVKYHPGRFQDVHVNTHQEVIWRCMLSCISDFECAQPRIVVQDSFRDPKRALPLHWLTRSDQHTTVRDISGIEERYDQNNGFTESRHLRARSRAETDRGLRSAARRDANPRAETDGNTPSAPRHQTSVPGSE